MHIVLTNTVMLNGGDRAILEAEMRLLSRACAPRVPRYSIVDDWGPVAAERFPGEVISEHTYYIVTRRRQVSAIGSRILRGLARRWLAHTAVPRFRLALGLWIRGWRRLAGLVFRTEERKAVELYAGADLVVSSGGTLLVDHYDLRHRFFEFDLVLALGVPLVLYTQSMGPFALPRHRKALQRILPRARAILLRDDASLRHVQDLGVPTARCSVTADAAFALGESVEIERGMTSRLPPRGLRVVVSARRWPHFQTRKSAAGMAALLRSLQALIVHILADPEARVTLLSTCQGVPQYHFDDSEFAIEIRAGLPEELKARVTVDREFHTPTALLRELSKFDLVVAMRMHCAILALNTGRPVLPLAYEFKTTELFGRLGLPSWVVDVEDIEPELLKSRWQIMLAECDGRRAGLFKAVLREREEAVRSAALVVSASATEPAGPVVKRWIA